MQNPLFVHTDELSDPQSLLSVQDEQTAQSGTHEPEDVSQTYPLCVQSESELHGGTRQFPVELLHS